MGSKIAALQGGFMSDLNNRLKLGPQAPKKEEEVKDEPAEEKEKAPLVDARKGRARGPQRRAPAKSASPSPAAALAVPEEKERPQQKLSCSIHSCIFAIDPESEHGELVVPNKQPAETTEDSPPVAKKSEPEEQVMEHHEASPSSSQEENKGVEHAVAQENAPETEHIEGTGAHVEHVEDVADEAEVEDKEDGGEDLSASTATLKPEINLAKIEGSKENEDAKEEGREE
jgi:hypothetical protein